MEVGTLIIFGSLGMSVLAIGIILFVVAYQKRVLANKSALQAADNAFQKQLIEATILSEQQEREKISKNLHDDLGTSLNILKLNLEKLHRNQAKPQVVSDVSNMTLEMINQAIHDLRAISRDLMPATLLKLGFVQSLNELSRNLNTTGKIKINFRHSDNIPKLGEKLEVQLYRICQEIINNLIKHSSPEEVNINVQMQNGNEVLVKFEHNGTGISNNEIKEIYALNKGVGLKSIESRVRMINGEINYFKNQQKPSYIEIQAPIEQT